MRGHDDKMSFLPEDYVQRRIERRTNLICLTLFAVVLAGVIGAYAVTSRHRQEVKQHRQAINAAYTDAAKRLEQLDQLQQRKQQMLRKAQITSLLIEPVPRSFLLADLINRMPKTLSLLELDMNSQVIQPIVSVSSKKTALANKKKKDEEKKQENPVPVYRVTLTLIGVAPTDVQVASYMSTLSRSPLMSDVNLIYSEEKQIADSLMRRFRIEATLSEKADVRSLDLDELNRELKKNPMENTGPVKPAAVQAAESETGSAPELIVEGAPPAEE